MASSRVPDAVSASKCASFPRLFSAGIGTEHEGTMRGRHLILREAVTIGGLPPVKLFPIPARIPVLDVPLICLSLSLESLAIPGFTAMYGGPSGVLIR